jgi:serine O-acetyltransferase
MATLPPTLVVDETMDNKMTQGPHIATNLLLDDTLAELLRSYETGAVNDSTAHPVPARDAVARILRNLEELLFPGFFCEESVSHADLKYRTGARLAEVLRSLERQVMLDQRHTHGERYSAAQARSIPGQFIATLPALRAQLQLDVDALFEGDPAVRSREEIILAYPGLRAVIAHRIAHQLWIMGVGLMARLMAELAHAATGIDIHPGATIGHHFYVDHGTGVVIGETTTIGNHVKVYQGVSLGALSVQKHLQDKKRHPTIEDHVTLYAGCTILGGNTVVGHHSIVGGNVWLVRSVPPYSLVEHQASVRVVSRDKDTSFDPVI